MTCATLDPKELWPVWMPPSPPASDLEFDMYSDPVVGFWYETNCPLQEKDLPPVINLVPPPQVVKVLRERPTPVKKESSIESKTRSRSSSIDTVESPRQPTPLVGVVNEAVPVVAAVPHVTSFTARSLFDGGPSSRYRRDQRRPLTPPPLFPDLEQEDYVGPPWTVVEDYHLLQAVTKGQQMAYNFLTANFGHAPNWDFIAGRVNCVSDTFRSARQCSLRFQRTLLPREDGRMVVHDPVTKKPYRVPEEEKNKRIKTGQLYQSEGKGIMAERTKKRMRMVRKASAKKYSNISVQVTPLRHGRELVLPEKHAKVMQNHVINYNMCLNPTKMAEIRIERQKERDRQTEREKHLRETQAVEQRARMNQQAAAAAAQNTQTAANLPVPAQLSRDWVSLAPMNLLPSPVTSPLSDLPPLYLSTPPNLSRFPHMSPIRPGSHFTTVAQSNSQIGPPAAVAATKPVVTMPNSVPVSIQHCGGSRYVVGTVAYTLTQHPSPVQYVVANSNQQQRQSSPFRTTVTRLSTPPNTPAPLTTNLVSVSSTSSSNMSISSSQPQPIRVPQSSIRPKITLQPSSGGAYVLPGSQGRNTAVSSIMRPTFQPSIVRRATGGPLPKIQTISRSAASLQSGGVPQIRMTRPTLISAAESVSIPSISNFVTQANNTPPTQSLNPPPK